MCEGSDHNHAGCYKGGCGMTEVNKKGRNERETPVVSISFPYLAYHITLKINICTFISLDLHFSNIISRLLFSLGLRR